MAVHSPLNAFDILLIEIGQEIKLLEHLKKNWIALYNTTSSPNYVDYFSNWSRMSIVLGNNYTSALARVRFASTIGFGSKSKEINAEIEKNVSNNTKNTRESVWKQFHKFIQGCIHLLKLFARITSGISDIISTTGEWNSQIKLSKN
jgi:hypothetical protein